MCYWCDRQTLLKPYAECEWCESCQASCDFRLRAQAEYYASRLFSQNTAMEASEEQSNTGDIADESHLGEDESMEDESAPILFEAMDDSAFFEKHEVRGYQYEQSEIGKCAHGVLDLAVILFVIPMHNAKEDWNGGQTMMVAI